LTIEGDTRPTLAYRISGCLARILHRVRLEGVGNVPREGGALLVANHASWFDGPLVVSAVERPVRVVGDRRLARRRALAWYLAQVRAILISPEDRPREMLTGIRAVRAALTNGELVCVFPEGQLTRDGRIGEFNSGPRCMLRGSNVPVVPLGICGVWGGFFSYRYGHPMAHFPRHPRPRVTLRFGPQLPPETPQDEIRRHIAALALEPERSCGGTAHAPGVTGSAPSVGWATPGPGTPSSLRRRHGRWSPHQREAGA